MLCRPLAGHFGACKACGSCRSAQVQLTSFPNCAFQETSDNFFSTVTALLSGDWINESSWSWTSAEKSGPRSITDLGHRFCQLRPARSGTEWDWQHDWEWQPDLEWHSEWDWQRVWERLFLSPGLHR